MIQRLAAVVLLLCPVMVFAHNDPVPPTDSFYTGSAIFKSDSVCSTCHNGGLNTSNGNVKVLFNGLAATTYTPGATIPITVTITDTGGGRRVWGYELASRFTGGSSNGTLAGTLASTNANTSVNTLQFPASGKVMTHNGVVTSPGTTFSFTMNWTAPASGSVVFSVAGNAANGDGDLTGDRIYTTEVTLTPAASTPPPSIGSGGVVNAASFSTAPNNQVAQGQIISIFGSNFTSAEADATAVPLPTTLGTSNTSVTACGQKIPLFKIFPGQINAQLPFECSTTGTAGMTVTANGQTSSIEPVTLALGSPGIFSINSNGVGDGAILHSDNVTLVSSAKPAKAGEIIVIYCTGLGPTNPAFASGSAATAANDTTNPVTVTIGGANAAVQYKGLVVSFVGLYQVNVIVPSGLGTVSAPVVMTVGSGNVSRTGVTVAVAP